MTSLEQHADAMPDRAALVGEVEQLNGALSAYKAICEHRNQQNETLRTQLAASQADVARLRGLVEMSEIWLNAALGCKDWVWDVDQHEAATETLRDLRAAIKETQP